MAEQDYYSASDDEVEDDKVQIRYCAPALARAILLKGVVQGLGKFKGTHAIAVKTPQGNLVHFHIGRRQGLDLGKLSNKGEWIDLNDFETSAGVYYLKVEHSDALYTLVEDRDDFFEVDLVSATCPTCKQKSTALYSARKCRFRLQ